MKISSLTVFVFVIQAAYSNQAAPDPCCTAEQFQISFGGTVAQSIDDRPESIQEFFNGAFDFKSQRYGLDVYIHNYTDGTDMRYKVYQLINKGVEYIVLNSQCTEVPLQLPPSRCVPDSATYVTSFWLGDQALYLDDWKVKGSSAGFVGEVYSTTASKDCTPGPMNAVGTMDVQGQKVKFMSQGTYMNFTNSISDPDYWFVPPASCSNATQQVSESWVQPLHTLRRLRATNFFL
ncbi:putative development-specific protein LVN1.2 [Apostichopus japonicus]|uniref:Putative development-specific protein LVN1.2 n=1 Tax=Stichopus japonicus TaxID=307972 RepID=A0A2G8L657_STIJA|nr:putative development-specific protein LVN1.2 [Apostichopus japonicus]